MIPENGVDLDRFPEPPPKPTDGPLRVAFVGRLVPYKGADILIEAMEALLRDGRAQLVIVGDGPERPQLHALASRLGVVERIDFRGWQNHRQVAKALGEAHVFGFPSVREFGGGVVLEAMVQRAVPLVVDYGGPGDIIHEAIGIKVPLATRGELILGFRAVLHMLCSNRALLSERASAARDEVLSKYTWQAKAAQIVDVYRSVITSSCS